MADVDRLYAVRPEEFTAARNALAKELKTAGDKAAAAEIAKLRRPSVGAWALNQVARQHPDLVEAALEAGAGLRLASEAAASGDASGLRAATAAERAAAQAVVKAARTHLGARAEALVPGLLGTLRVAALDDEVAAQLRAGRLTTEHEQAGFGFGRDSGDSVVVPRRASTSKARGGADQAGTKLAGKAKLRAVPDPPEPDPEERAREKAARAEARAADRQRKKDQKAAEDKARRLEREAERLAKEATVAEAEAAEARRKADDAMAKAEEARAAADDLS
jgi:hypothetical protein